MQRESRGLGGVKSGRAMTVANAKFAVGDAVVSCAVRGRNGFKGHVSDVGVSGEFGIYYNVRDADGAEWHLVAKELTGIGDAG